MKKSLDDLRKMAGDLLASGKAGVDQNTWGTDVKNLLEELSIYKIELEHQNSELERSERDLAKLHAEYKDLFDNAPVAYIIFDTSRNIVRANNTFVNMFVPVSARERQLEGRCFDEFVDPAYQNSFYLFTKMLQKKGTPMPLEIKLIDRFAKPRFVVIIAGEGAPDTKLFRIAINDISMRKRLEAQLIQAKEKAETEDRQKSIFLSNISHELRTPLTTITGFGSMLKDPNLSNEVKDGYIDSIVTASEMLLSLTDDVMDLSVLESGTLPLRRNATDVQVICRDTITLIQRKCIGKNVLLAADINGIPKLQTDQARLRQVFFTVLDHAASNATDGTIFVRGSYDAEDSRSGILTLRFTGKNVFSSESILAEEAINKASAANRTGLGLFMTKRIISAMHGKMIWEHPLDALRIELPVDVSRDEPRTQKSEINIESIEQSGKTCLLVDDVVMNLKVLAAMLSRLNITPTLATSGKEALEMLRTNHYDLIMTDLWMPEMNGEELAMVVRQNPEFNNTPIYAVTADVERNGNFDMEFFSGTVVKPVNFDRIRKIVSLL